MSPRPKRRKQTCSSRNVELFERRDGRFDAVHIPESDIDPDSEHDSEPQSECNSESDCELDSESEAPQETTSNDESNSESGNVIIPTISYHRVLDSYEENQAKLEPNHNYTWSNGEKKYAQLPKNEFLLSGKTRDQIRGYSLVQLFELFFSQAMKTYIIESTHENGHNLTPEKLDVFLGIIITSIFNKRKSERDYWSTNSLLRCEPVSSAMSRDDFLKIKSEIKLWKPTDRNNDDKAWRIRKVLEIFRTNIMQFGFFSTALSIDEMMVKFHGRTNLLQFMPNKPERFGIKLWGICNTQGYLFDCDVYCGRGSNIFSSDGQVKLSKCALGSRVVLLMIQKLLASVVPRKIDQYHLYFDNFFCSPDLLVHLKLLGLKATGTVRANRVKVSNGVDNKSERGTYAVQHEKNSGLNFITVMDSKPVSLLSTAVGIEPLHNAKRFSKKERRRTDIAFPVVLSIYNTFMGGVDQHDAHCSNLMPFIRAKKWTWAMFLRLIQSSLTNATVIRNLVHESEKKVGTKEVALTIAESYLAKNKAKTTIPHKSVTVGARRSCINVKVCGKRTFLMCEKCDMYVCSACFGALHSSG